VRSAKLVISRLYGRRINVLQGVAAHSTKLYQFKRPVRKTPIRRTRCSAGRHRQRLPFTRERSKLSHDHHPAVNRTSDLIHSPMKTPDHRSSTTLVVNQRAARYSRVLCSRVVCTLHACPPCTHQSGRYYLGLLPVRGLFTHRTDDTGHSRATRASRTDRWTSVQPHFPTV